MEEVANNSNADHVNDDVEDNIGYDDSTGDSKLWLPPQEALSARC